MAFIELSATYNQLNDNGRIMREQDQGLLSHINQMRYQQCKRWCALLVPLFNCNL